MENNLWFTSAKIGKFLLVAKDNEKEIKMVARKRAVDLISGVEIVGMRGIWVFFEMNYFLINL